MAKKVKGFFRGGDRQQSEHGNSKYPWSRWMDGSIWELLCGTDFDCQLSSFRGILYASAKRHGISVRIQTQVPLGLIRFQFFSAFEEDATATQDEVEAEAVDQQPPVTVVLPDVVTSSEGWSMFEAEMLKGMPTDHDSTD